MSNNSAPIGSNSFLPPLQTEELAASVSIARVEVEKEKNVQVLPFSDLTPTSPATVIIHSTSPKRSFFKDVKANFLMIIRSANAQAKTSVRAQALNSPTAALSRAAEGIHGLNLLLSIPTAIIGTYSYAKNWKKSNAQQKALGGATLVQGYAATAEASAFIIKSIPGIAQTSATGAQIAFSFLGPIAASLGSILAAIKGTQRGKAAHEANKKAQAISTIIQNETNKLQKSDGTKTLTSSILEREQNRFRTVRNFKIMSSLKYFLTSAALGAIATIGILTLAAAATAAALSPVGWVAAGALGAAALIGIGVYAYKKYNNKQMAKQEQIGLAAALGQTIKIEEMISKITEAIPGASKDPSVVSEQIRKAVKDHLMSEVKKALITLDSKDLKVLIKTSADAVTDEDITNYAEEILNTPTWPSGPTLIQNVLVSLEAQIKE